MLEPEVAMLVLKGDVIVNRGGAVSGAAARGV
jgi:hypothetical protein